MSPTKTTMMALTLMAIPQMASAEYRYLCTSAPRACEYAPSDAPPLKTNVCYDGSTAGPRLKGTAPCPHGWNPYQISHGEVVDPQTGEVAVYAPLDDACEAGHCVEYVPHDDDGTENVMCCENGGPCWPGSSCGGVIYWCHDGVTNQDGTVECFNAEQL